MSKLERLMKLTATLLATSVPLSAERLQERIEGYPDGQVAFRRAFERDKDDLREMGVPIAVLPVPDADPPVDGYLIRGDEYYLEDPGLDPDEIAAVALASQLVQFEGTSTNEALWKLGGLGDRPAGAPGAELAAVASDPSVPQLFDAIRAKAVVNFLYGGSERELEPWRLSHQRGRWYVAGFDRSRADERNFRVDRIDGPLTIGRPDSFVRPDDAGRVGERQPWEFEDEAEMTARVHIDADRALWATNQIGTDHVVEEQPDGSIIIEIRVTNIPAFRSFVLGFLDHAEVLGPPELRADLVRWLEAQL